MNFTKTMFALAIGSVGIMGAMSATAATLGAGDTLTIVTGSTYSGAATAGTTSWFAMDNSGDSKIQLGEKVALFQGTTGIVIGASNTAPGEIDAPWAFFSSTGKDFVTTAITQTSATSLDLSGWSVNWSTIALIPMGSGAWTPLNAVNAGMATSGYANGSAVFSWDGNYGSTYTLDYTATVPAGDPSNFGGVQYALHLSGVVTQAAPVPEASTYGMMLAGLGLVGFAVRRRKLV
ncbi:MAG: PEP-CTERM sorting domain-containing protein [Burkholderiales bacterium]